ncbi:hypothetical protein ACI65C_006328 [Semiaphis heraclei]
MSILLTAKTYVNTHPDGENGRLRCWFISLAMKAGAVDTDHIQGKGNSCPSCRVSGSVTFLLVAAYFYFGCKHVKPVCYFGTPSMIYLAVARSLDLTPFKD